MAWYNKLRRVHCINRGVTCYDFQIEIIFSSLQISLANSVEPDEMSHYAVFYLWSSLFAKVRIKESLYKGLTHCMLGNFTHFLSLLCLCLTSNQQLRSYGDGPQLNISSDRLVKPRIEPATPGLQGKWFIHYTRLLICLSSRAIKEDWKYYH